MALILCECRWGLYIKINCDRDAWKEKCQRMGKGGMYLFQEKLKITLTGFKPCQGYFQKRLKIHAPWFLYLISSASP